MTFAAEQAMKDRWRGAITPLDSGEGRIGILRAV
jgi:hypothetical protein